jgi:hypothetical protein
MRLNALGGRQTGGADRVELFQHALPVGQPPLLGGRADLRQHLFGRAAFVLVLLVRQVLADPPLPFLVWIDRKRASARPAAAGAAVTANRRVIAESAVPSFLFMASLILSRNCCF